MAFWKKHTETSQVEVAPASDTTVSQLGTAEIPLNLSEAEFYRTQAMAHKVALKRNMKTFLLTGLIMIITTVLLLIAGYAWFSNNKTVSATGMNMESANPSISLFIAKGNTPDYLYLTSAQMSLYGNLYPVSTLDCKTWFTDNIWNEDDEVTDYQQLKITEKQAEDSSSQLIAGSYVGLFSAKSATIQAAAYNVSTYTLYTSLSGGTLDVYLNETDPIVVSYSGNTHTRNLLGALRVGVVVDDSLKFVYAPVVESEAGNSAGSEAGYYYAVNGLESLNLVSNADEGFYMLYTDSTISKITAAKNEGDENYTAASDHESICTADYDGTVVKVYVWLEGTDAQAILGISDDDTTGIKVTLNFVGVST